jgi:hypothetical protein
VLDSDGTFVRSLTSPPPKTAALSRELIAVPPSVMFHRGCNLSRAAITVYSGRNAQSSHTHRTADHCALPLHGILVVSSTPKVPCREVRTRESPGGQILSAPRTLRVRRCASRGSRVLVERGPE